jgi:hypothetical protein
VSRSDTTAGVRAGHVAATAVAAAQPAVLAGLALLAAESESESESGRRPGLASGSETGQGSEDCRGVRVLGRHFCLLGLDLLIDEDMVGARMS